MKGRGAIFRRSLLATALIISASVYLFAKYENGSFNNLSGEMKHKRLVPVGELTKGTAFKQPVDCQRIRRMGPEWTNSSLCLEIYMANYGRRTNTGTIRLGIQLDGRRETLPVAAASVTDNAYHRICLSTVTLADIYASHELQILVEGVDSPAESAVTAWSTLDNSQGQIHTVDEKLVGRSLVYRLGFFSESSKRDRDSMVLAVLAFVAIFVLVSQPGGSDYRQGLH